MSDSIKIGRIDPRDPDILKDYEDSVEAQFYCAWYAAEMGDYHAASAHLYVLGQREFSCGQLPWDWEFVKTGDRASDWKENCEQITRSYLAHFPHPEPFDRNTDPPLRKHWILSLLQDEFPNLDWWEYEAGRQVRGYLPSRAQAWLGFDFEVSKCAIEVIFSVEEFEHMGETRSYRLFTTKFFGIPKEFDREDIMLAYLRDMAGSVSVNKERN